LGFYLVKRTDQPQLSKFNKNSPSSHKPACHP